MLEDIINEVDGSISDLALRTLKHDKLVLETKKEMQNNDEGGVYKTFIDDYVPKRYRPYVGHYTREYDLLREDSEGNTTDIFEIKTNHTPKAYVKAVRQLSYAHLLHQGEVDTWYVSWRKDKHGGGRIVKPIWKKEDWDKTTSISDLYNPDYNGNRFNYKKTIEDRL